MSAMVAPHKHFLQFKDFSRDELQHLFARTGHEQLVVMAQRVVERLDGGHLVMHQQQPGVGGAVQHGHGIGAGNRIGSEIG